jgi:cellulose synthase/poly-beta-1,6-N-acetylglucosamine synthase-like glycosyltransferase/peptidoglycan/xylan/chitin deacetylase (PgdA/CDA1 family)/spore germination protein YaaH
MRHEVTPLPAKSSEPVFSDPTRRRRWIVVGLLVAVLGMGATPLIVLANNIIHGPHLAEPVFAAALPSRPSDVSGDIGSLVVLHPGTDESTSAQQRVERPDWPQRRLAYLRVDNNSTVDSVRSNLTAVDTLLVEGYTFDPTATKILDTNESTAERVLDEIRSTPTHVRMIAVVTDEEMSPRAMIETLSDRGRRGLLITRLLEFARDRHFDGVDLDISSIDDQSMRRYEEFIGELHRIFSSVGLSVLVTVGLEDSSYRIDRLSRQADLVVIDTFNRAPPRAPAALAADAWFAQEIGGRVEGANLNNVIVALANYAYDWGVPGQLDRLSLQDAVRLARQANATIAIDPATLNPRFTYADPSGQRHEVWLLDATSVFNQMAITANLGLGGIALGRLGTEDAAVWALMRQRGPPNETIAANLEDFSFLHQVEYRGTGAVLHLVGDVERGARALTYDSARNRIVAEHVTTFPHVPIAYQFGQPQARQVALTFDDGPDPRYTKDIVDILDRYHVPATFFLVGRNVLQHPELARLVVEHGYEIGNHTFFHPDITTISRRRYNFELNANERVIESSVGRRTILFRPPDGETLWATSPSGLELLADASAAGYFAVGYTIDTLDWAIHDRNSIVQAALEGARAENGGIVLMHDSGGDRAATVAALPAVIEGLRADGFTLVSVGDLVGASYDEVVPAITRDGLTTSLQDDGFILIRAGGLLFRLVFGAAIVLSMGRVVLIVLLSLANRRQSNAAASFMPRVTVVVPAHNEEAVIPKTIRSLLASRYPDVRVLVIDDGSTDGTAAIVSSLFQNDDRVQLVSKSNGGKASALNVGLAMAGTEIVVALDADTQFRSDTIFHLTRPFADPRVAAVAGNAKVGNRVNLITRWQALEYIISQNLDRRAFELLNGISVVPGAVGAWRRSAVLDVGGFASDTLAEDADLTIRLARVGYRVRNAPTAIAMTEAPDTVRGFLGQRSRWTLGTLQAVWKSRSALLRRRGGSVGLIVLPHILLFQFVLPLISPLADLFVLLALLDAAIQHLQNSIAPAANALPPTLLAYLIFLLVDFVVAFAAYVREPEEDRSLALWLPLQRFFYRQLLYYVTIKSVARALLGTPTGWISVTRKSTVATGLPVGNASPLI